MQLHVFKNESENGYDYEILKLTSLEALASQLSPPKHLLTQPVQNPIALIHCSSAIATAQTRGDRPS
jgi:hypothetical protein